MLGHIMEWFYSGLAGIRQDEKAVAFQKININPEPVGNIITASGSYISPYGLISSEWNKTANEFVLKVEIPANTTATVYLPANQSSVITINDQSFKNSAGSRLVKFENGKALIGVGSGTYQFKVQSKNLN